MRITLKKAVELLNHGLVVALPTETVYGLAASLHQPEAIEAIFKTKKRPSSNPLIIHVADSAQIRDLVEIIPTDFESLSQAFWPGPLTLILPAKQEKIPSIIRANLPTAAFRIPSHPLVREILSLTGPLVMPSANLSGRPSATHVEHIEADFGLDFPVLDGGVCTYGVESTILIHESEKWLLGRLGFISPEEFKPILGYVPKLFSSTQPKCPGQHFKHYSPHARLHLSSFALLKDQCCIIGFREGHYPKTNPLIILGSLDQPKEVAENLYAVLRQLDLEGIQEAWVDMDFPSNGLWNTIRERLTRAAEITQNNISQ